MKTVVIEKKNGLYWLWLSFLVIILDQGTKYIMVNHGPSDHFLYVSPFLNLALAYNTGAAFSFLSQAGFPAILLFVGTAIVMSIILCIWLYRLPSHNSWLSVSLALIIGGALGNLFDRLSYGYVIDFIHFHLGNWSWPIFNLADTGITIGAIMLLIDILKKKS